MKQPDRFCKSCKNYMIKKKDCVFRYHAREENPKFVRCIHDKDVSDLWEWNGKY